MLLLSIIIPIYNTPIAKLDRCKKSVDALMLKRRNEVECILVDDGSQQYIEDWYNSQPDKCFYKYIKKENGGASSARNAGIDKADGQFVLFVDADDEIIVNNVLDMLGSDLQHADIVLSDLTFVKGKDTVIWKAFQHDKKTISFREVLSALSSNGKLNGPVCKLIRRKFLFDCNVRFPEEMITGEDAVFFYRLLKNKPEIYYFGESTYRYYHEPETFKNRMKKDSLRILNDYRTMHIEFLYLLDSFTLDRNIYETILKIKTENYIKQLYNYKLDLIAGRCFSNDIYRKLREARDLAMQYENNVIHKCSNTTKLKYCLIGNSFIVIDTVAAYARRLYIRCKAI